MPSETFLVTKAFPGHKVGGEANFEPSDVAEYVKDGFLVKKDAAAASEVETELESTADRMADFILSKAVAKLNAKSKGAPFSMSVPDDFASHAEPKEDVSLGELLQAIGYASAASFGSRNSKAVNLLNDKYADVVTVSKSFDGDFAKATPMDGAKSKAVQQESQGTAGGFAVKPQFTDAFFELLFPKSTLLAEVTRRTCDQLDYYEPTWDYSLGGNGADPYLAGMTGGWIPEGGAMPATSATVRQFHLKMNTFGATNQCTRQLLADAPRLQSMLMEKFAQTAAYYLTSAIFSGDGQGKPTGFTNALTKSALSVARTASPGVGDLLNDLATMFSKRLTDEGSTSRLFWMVSPSAEKQLILLNDKSGKVVYLSNYPGTAGGPATTRVPMSLFGCPVIRSQFPSAYGTAKDFVLVDPSAYVLAMRQDLEIAASEHVAFTTNLMTYRLLLRADGGSPVNSTLTLANNDVVAPFVYLT